MTSFIIFAALAILMIAGGSIGANIVDEWENRPCWISLTVLTIVGWVLLSLSLIALFALACRGAFA